MRAVLQRVIHASVAVEGETIAQIDRGWLILLGVTHSDTTADLDYLVQKTLGLRGFCDVEGKMNRAITEVAGQLLVVSQFTLWGDCRKGRRPSFTAAAEPSKARSLYEAYIDALAASGLKVATGQFGAAMQVNMAGDGPVTLLLDSQKLF